MKWEQIMEQHPSRFVLVEALKANSSNRLRHLEDMTVIQDYDRIRARSWSGYKHFHKLYPSRELYVFHTSRTDVEVVEEIFSGVRQHT